MKAYKYNVLLIGDGPFTIRYPDFPQFECVAEPDSIVKGLSMAKIYLEGNIRELRKLKHTCVKYSDSDKIGPMVATFREGITFRMFKIQLDMED
jgi:hypothetical protein